MKKLLATLLVLSPLSVFASDTGFTNLQNTSNGLSNVAVNLTKTVNNLIPFMVGIAVIVLIYGIIKYVIASGPEEKKAARGYIVYGIIGIAVIIAIFGLANLLLSFFGVNSGDAGNSPSITPFQ